MKRQKVKNSIAFVVATMIICMALTGCGGSHIEITPTTESNTPAPNLSPEIPTTPETSADISDEPNTTENTSEPYQEETYTIEQIQTAMVGRIEGTIIAVEKVEMDRDSITFTEPGEITYDLSEATRYRVTYEISIPNDALYLVSIDSVTGEEHVFRQYEGEEYRQEGYQLIFTFTEYFYFNDENGTPVSTAWHC